MIYTYIVALLLLGLPTNVSARIKKTSSFKVAEEARLRGKFEALRDMPDFDGKTDRMAVLRDEAERKGMLNLSRSIQETSGEASGIFTPESAPAKVAAKSVTSLRRDVVQSLEMVSYGMSIARDAGNLYGGGSDFLRNRQKLLDNRARYVAEQSDPQFVEWHRDAITAHKKIMEALVAKGKKDALDVFSKASSGASGDDTSQLAEVGFQILLFLTEPNPRHTLDAEGFAFADMEKAIEFGKKHFTPELFTRMNVLTICTELAKDSVPFTDIGRGSDTKDAMWLDVLLVVAYKKLQAAFGVIPQIAALRKKIVTTRGEAVKALQSVKEVPVVVDQAKVDTPGYVEKLATEQARGLQDYKRAHPEAIAKVDSYFERIAPILQRFSLLEKQLVLLSSIQSGAGKQERAGIEQAYERSEKEYAETEKNMRRKEPSILANVVRIAGGAVGVAILASMAAGAAREAGYEKARIDSAEKSLGQVWGLGSLFTFFAGAGASAYKMLSSEQFSKNMQDIPGKIAQLVSDGLKVFVSATGS